MSDKDVKLNVSVSDKGTTKQVVSEIDKASIALREAGKVARKAAKEVKDFNAALDKSGKPSTAAQENQASKLGKDAKIAAAEVKKLEAAAKALNKATGPSAATTAALKRTKGAVSNAQEAFDKNRGLVSSSGAAGRDFANQARGLNGLVPLYAAFAANVFALGTAFRALSESMDTTNMVKGLDQLGAAVGRNLGGAAEKVAELSGGAISLAEALRAVAQTSSAGIASKDIERLASVARAASTALGVAMPDAINRLSRGITKLEPELLDELGIMTRLEPAVDIYARELGKAATQLTQFERRQAFTNAVLAEGELKFGAIANIAVNPFDKLLSSLKDLFQVGTSFLNIILAPIVSLLTESPTALVGAIGALGLLLAKQALPATKQFKTNLADAASEAKKLSEARKADTIEAKERVTSPALIAQRQKALELATDAALIAEKEVKARRNIIAGGSKRLQQLNTEGSVLRRIQELRSNEPTSRKDRDAIGALAGIERNKGNLNSAKRLSDIQKSALRQQVALNKLDTQSNIIQETQSQIFKRNIVIQANVLAEKRAIAASTRKAIISNAAFNGGLVGVGDAFSIMNKEIAASGLKLNTFSKRLLQAQGVMVATRSAVSTLTRGLASLGNAFALFGILTLAFSTLKSAISANAQAADRFTSAISDSDEALKNVDRTIRLIVGASNQKTIKGIQAMSNAFSDLTEKIKETNSAGNQTIKDRGLFDTTTNFLAGLAFVPFTDSDENILADKLSEQVLGALTILKQSGLKDEATKTFQDILSIKDLDADSVKEAIISLSEDGVDKLINAVARQASQLSSAASGLDSFKTSIVALDLAFAQFIQATSNTDDVFKIGAALQNSSNTMLVIANSTSTTAEQIEATLTELRTNPGSSALFGDKFVDQLIDTRIQLEAISEERKKILEGKNTRNGTPNSVQDFGSEAKNRQAQLDDLDRRTTEINTKGADILREGLESGFEAGSSLIRQSLDNVIKRGQLLIASAKLVGLTGEGRAIEEQRIRDEEIKIRLAQADQSIDLLLASTKQTAALEKNSAALALNSSKSDKDTSKETQKSLNDAVAITSVFVAAIQQGKQITAESVLILADGNKGIADQVFAQATSINQLVSGIEATRISGSAQLEASAITGRAGQLQGAGEDNARVVAARQAVRQADAEILSIREGIIGFSTVQNRLDVNQLNITTQLADLELRRNELAIELKIASKDTEKNKVGIIQLLELELQIREQTSLLAQNEIALGEVATAGLARRLETEKSIAAVKLNAGLKAVELSRAELDSFKQLTGVNDEFVISQTAALDIRTAQLELSRVQLETSQQNTALVVQAETDLASLKAAGQDLESNAAQAIIVELERKLSLNKDILDIAKQEQSTREKIVKITEKNTKILTKQQRIQKNSASAVTNLSKNFGKAGKSIGGLVKAFGDLTTNTQKNNIALKERKKILADASATDQQRIDATKQIGILEEQNQIQRLNSFSAASGAAASFFDEQSAGFKVLTAVEQGFSAISIALSFLRIAQDAKETVSSVENNAVRSAGDAAEAGVSGVQAVINTIASLPFPANLVAGVVVAGIVGALLSTIGGKAPKVGSSGGSGLSAEEVQSVQGTGQTFVGGQKVNRIGGALGANDEKVKDIANSLTQIESSTLLTSKFGSKAANILEQIELNTRSLTAAILTGTDIGSSGSTFFNAAQSGLKENGLVSLGLDIARTITTVVSTALGGPLGGIASKLAGKIFDPIIKSLFGTKIKVSVIDKGVLATANLQDLLDEVASFSEFETLKIKKTKKAFGIKTGSKSKIEVFTKDLESSVNESFVLLFTNLVDLATSAASEVFGSGGQSITNELDKFNVDFKVSGFGLSGEEFSEAILAESNVVINQLVQQAIPLLGIFRDLGEGFLGTLVRVANDMEVAKDRLTRVGIDFGAQINEIPDLLDQGDVLDSILALKSGLNSAIQQVILDTGDSRRVSDDNTSLVSDLETSFLDELERIATKFGGVLLPVIEAFGSAQIAFDQAQISILNSKRAGVQLDRAQVILSGGRTLQEDADTFNGGKSSPRITELVESSKALESATKSLVSVFSSRVGITVTATETLIKAFGGLENFVEATDFFFENFFTEQEQILAKQKELLAAGNDLVTDGIITQEQLDTLVGSGDDLRLEYRELIQTQDLTGESAAESSARLLALAPAIDEIAPAFEDAVKSIKDLVEDNFGDFGSLLEDALLGKLEPEFLGESIAQDIKDGFLISIGSSFIQEAQNAIVEQMITPLLTEMLTTGVVGSLVISTTLDAIRDDIINKAKALALLFGDQGFLDALAEATKPILSIVKTLLDNAQPRFITDAGDLFKEADAAFDVLSRSVEKEQDRLAKKLDQEIAAIDLTIEGLNTSIDATSDSVEKLTSLADLLSSTIDTLNPIGLLAARRAIAEATVEAQGGKIIDSEDISQAISKLSTTSTNTFGTALDFKRSTAVNSALLGSLSSVVTGQLSAEEVTLGVLKDTLKASEASRDILQETFDAEIERLEGILDTAGAQLDELKGINQGIVSVTDALERFQLAIANIGVGRDASQFALENINTGATINALPGFTPVNTPANALPLPIVGPSSISDQSIRDFAAIPGTTGLDLFNAAKANDISFARAQQVLGFSDSDADEFFSNNPTLSRFATGGVTSGGPVLVGELGPEVVSLPKGSNVSTASQTKNLLGSNQVVNELKQLREEMNAILISIAGSTDVTAAKLKKFDNIGMPETRAAA